MSRTISSSTTGPVVLNAVTDNPLTLTSTGTVTSTGSGADGIDGGSGTTWTISNAGKVSSASKTGISLGGSGVVTNSGSISGSDALDLSAGGSVTNLSGGSISSTGSSGAGVFFTGGTGTLTNSGGISAVKFAVLVSAGGNVSNTQSGSISAGDIGVFLQNQAGTVTNAGFISGTGTQGTGVYLENNGNVTNTSTGTITGQKFGAFIEGGFGTLANYGSISGATYDGVILGLGGIITNAAGASISSVNNGIYVKYRASGTVTNSGTVSASGTSGAGIDLGDGGVVTNTSTGRISGGAFGVFITKALGSVSNTGSISGAKYDGVVLTKGGSVTNLGGASITGGSNGVYVESGSSGTVTNSGNITGTGSSSAGLDLGSGGSVTNNSGGTISGASFGVFSTGALGTVTNSGNISGTHGVGLEAGGSLMNNASGSISGQSVGVFAQGAAATVVNAGLLTATSGTGADIEGGGSITNQAGGTLSGSSFGIFITGGASTVTNAGTISGGSYAIDFSGSGTNRLVVDPGAVFTGRVLANSSGTNTLELAGGTGTLSGIGSGSFSNFQTLVADAGGAWTLSGSNTASTIVDNGTLSLTGSLAATTALDPSSSGLFQLQAGAILEVAAATGTQSHVNFVGNSELVVDTVASFGTNVGTASYAGPQLQDFTSGDKIDLKNFSSAGATLSYNTSTGVLQVSNGSQTADLSFQTSTLGSTGFQATSDGASGTFITTAASPPPPPPGPTVTSIATSGSKITNGNGDLDAGSLVTLTVNFSAPVTVVGGPPTLTLNDGGTANFASGSGSALTFTYAVAAGQNTPDLTVSSLNTNGATIQDASSDNADVSGATNYNPAGTLQIDTTAPTIAINTIATKNVVTKSNAASGFAISGTTVGAENGQTVTVAILNSANAVVDSFTTADQSNAWSVTMTSAQATALADGSYAVTANVSDLAGNPAPQASKAVTVDEDKTPEPPILTIANTSLNVTAGGSVGLGITATPVDPDDRVSVKITGLPSYETITAPAGDTVSRQFNLVTLSYTYTITESAAAAGTPLTGLTLTSHYTGTGHPVANLSVTASNTTSGETATSAAKTMKVTDPAATPSTSPSSSLNQVASLLDQFIAAGFQSQGNGAGNVVVASSTNNIGQDLVSLTQPHH